MAVVHLDFYSPSKIESGGPFPHLSESRKEQYNSWNL